MRGAGIVVLVLLASCGRIGFGAHGDGSVGGDDDDGGGGTSDGPDDGATAIDAPPFVDQCPPMIGVVPDTIDITGVVFRLSTMTPVPNATISALASIGGIAYGTANSAGDGSFTLTMTTGNMPIAPIFEVTKNGNVRGYQMPGRTYWRDESTGFVSAPQSDVDATYAAKNVTQDPASGSLYVVAMGCDFNPIAGVTFSTVPPTTFVYADDAGLPSATATQTGMPGIGFALNVPVGHVEVHAMKAGSTFLVGYSEILQHPVITAYEMEPQ